MNPLQKFQAAREAADAILDRAKAGNRPLTAAEIVETTKHLDEADELKKHLDAAARAKALLPGLFDGSSEDMNVGAGTDFKSAAVRQFSTAAGAEIKTRVSAMQGINGKALLGTTVAVPPVLSSVITLPRAQNSILELIEVVNDVNRDLSGDGNTGNQFGYIYQSVRTNNATAVADNATKPTSVFTFEERVDRYRVFAHLSEALPERFLEDYAAIETILRDEMAFGLIEAIENAVINGLDSDPANDNFDGLLNRSGILTQAAVGTDLVATLAAGRFALTTANENPTGYVLNPVDYNRLTMLRESPTGPLLFGTGRTQIEQVLGDVKVATSTKIAAGTALVGDFTKARMRVKQDAQLKVDASGVLFDKNQFKLRLENRVGFEVTRPSAFAKVTLPA
jgi:HK97 family phage major capsid protein